MAKWMGAGFWLAGTRFGHKAKPDEAANGNEAAPNAQSHYARYLEPLTELFERRRHEALAEYNRRYVIAIPGGVALFGVAVWLVSVVFKSNFVMIIFAGGLIVAGARSFILKPLEDYKSRVRYEVFPRIVSFFGEDFRYARESPWTMSRLKGSDLFETFNIENLEDYIRGSYKGVEIELVEADLKHQTGSGRNRRTRDVFDGLLFVLTPKKKFQGKIVVQRGQGALVNAINSIVTARMSGLQRVRLEDPEFEQKFQVFSDDQVAARTVLTTSFMQRLLDLGEVLGNDQVDCSFFDGLLLIRAPTSHNHFEPSSPFSPVDFQKDLDVFMREMQVVFQIVDTLALDMDIGL